MKLKINLVKNQVPEKIDLPKPILRKRKIILLSAVLLSVVLLLFPLVYFMRTIKKPTITPPKIVRKIKKPNKKEKKIANNFVIKHKKETKKQKETPKKQVKKVLTKPAKLTKKLFKEKEKTKENKRIEKIEKEVKNTPVFSIALEFENIPKKIEPQNQTEVKIPPLPEIFKIKPPKKKNKKRKTPPFYLVTIKTTRIRALQSFLKAKKIKYAKKSLIVNSGFRYDVYVGGFYSYPAVVEFAKALKEKKYNIYAIKNINLLYFVCIDRNIDTKKKEAYRKAWSRTRFKIIFIKKPQKTKIYTITFTTTNRSIIYALKRKGFYPIIKLVKNGA